ncbi:hypothetical protein L6452_06567 [Arctium lappa]|uniref:Uncharacterized protein n=1 Tax=Arctium lappa TaxID=4217 RepID=A0ACB9EJ23_ARCLA|nr:hypothetical protein L6452_06567 [Arctium lappa]
MATQRDSSSSVPPPLCSGFFMPHISVTSPLSFVSLIITSTPLQPSPPLSSTLNASMPSSTLLASNVASPTVLPLLFSTVGYSFPISHTTSGYEHLMWHPLSMTTTLPISLSPPPPPPPPPLYFNHYLTAPNTKAAQRIKSMVDRDDSPSHHAFVAVQSKGTSGSFNFMQQGTGKGRGKGQNYHGRGRGWGGCGQRYEGKQRTAPYSLYSAPTNASNRFQNGHQLPNSPSKSLSSSASIKVSSQPPAEVSNSQVDPFLQQPIASFAACLSSLLNPSCFVNSSQCSGVSSPVLAVPPVEDMPIDTK